MRNILSLVKREIEDHRIHYVLALLMGCIATVMIYVLFKTADSSGEPAFFGWTLLWLLGQLPCLMALDAMALARVQIAGDRHARISAFVCTLTPTRGQLFIAKWISGFVWILLGLCPVILILVFKESPPVLYASFLRTLMVGVIVILVTAYAMGQQLGFLEKKGFVLVVGALFLCLLASLLVIKGLSMPCYAILAALAVALCTRSWWAFHHVAL